MHRFLTLSEVARELRVSKDTIRRWIKEGRLRSFKPRKRHLIARDDIECFLAKTDPKTVNDVLSKTLPGHIVRVSGALAEIDGKITAFRGRHECFLGKSLVPQKISDGEYRFLDLGEAAKWAGRRLGTLVYLAKNRLTSYQIGPRRMVLFEDIAKILGATSTLT